jgi:hypothetical protein
VNPGRQIDSSLDHPCSPAAVPGAIAQALIPSAPPGTVQQAAGHVRGPFRCEPQDGLRDLRRPATPPQGNASSETRHASRVPGVAVDPRINQTGTHRRPPSVSATRSNQPTTAASSATSSRAGRRKRKKPARSRGMASLAAPEAAGRRGLPTPGGGRPPRRVSEECSTRLRLQPPASVRWTRIRL